MRRIARTKIYGVTSFIVVLAALAFGFWPKPTKVETDVVQRAALKEIITQEGKTRVIDRFVVSAPITGVSQRIKLLAGDEVTRGQILLSIEPSHPTSLDSRERAQAQARIAAAEATFGGAQARLHSSEADATLAAGELARIRRLSRSSMVSAQALDAAEARDQIAQANRRSAAFAVTIARYDLEAARAVLGTETESEDRSGTHCVPVLSPIDGHVLKVLHQSEGAVQPGTPLIEIGDPHSLEVETEVPSDDAVRIRPGTQVEYTGWGGDLPLEGTVLSVEPLAFTKVSALGVEEQRVRVISTLASEPKRWDRLGDGYKLDAHFVLWKKGNVLQIPTAALFRSQDHWAVFVIRSHRARLTRVQIGHRGALAVEITQGLSAGERVIVHPDSHLKDGARVTVSLSDD